MAGPMTSSSAGYPWVAQAAIPSYVFNNATGSVNLFNTFKMHPNFLGPVGFTAPDYAMQCLSHSKACASASINLPISEALARNDIHGTPFHIRTGISSSMGWDTCRHFDTVAHVAERFGDMTGKNIYEFGSGYGGLMRCMLDQWENIGTYVVNDLPEVTSFSQYYLAETELSGPTHTATIIADPTGSVGFTGSIDLFIAEYSMTEMDSGSMQGIYNQYCRNANGLFIRSNIKNSVQFQQFVKMIQWDFNVTVFTESWSRQQNRIIIGTKPKL